MGNHTCRTFASNITTQMKKVPFVAAVWLMLAFAAHGQNATPALFNLFGPLPKSMSNEELIQLKDGGSKISSAFYNTLQVVSDDHEVFPIGKMEVDKITHLFYADVKYGKTNNPDDYLIDVSSVAFDTKTGQMIEPGVNFYLGMVGHDALIRSSHFKVNNDIITFTIITTDGNGKKMVETTTYKMTGKFLEFVSSL